MADASAGPASGPRRADKRWRKMVPSRIGDGTSKSTAELLPGCTRLAELVPGAFLDLDAVVIGRAFDVGECDIAVLVRDSFDLIEPRQRVANVRGVGQRLLALLGKGVHAVWQLITIGRVERSVACVWFPCRACHAS